jgi:molecular chaperone IbpA
MLTTQLPTMTSTNYPPYNIVKTGSLSYDIEVALAGYSKKDVSVKYEDNILKIESVKSKDEKEKDGVLHKGIAKRSFIKSFTIADDIEIKGAELKDGLLKVSLEKIVPDNKKARTINIT